MRNLLVNGIYTEIPFFHRAPCATACRRCWTVLSAGRPPGCSPMARSLWSSSKPLPWLCAPCLWEKPSDLSVGLLRAKAGANIGLVGCPGLASTHGAIESPEGRDPWGSLSPTPHSAHNHPKFKPRF